MKIEFKKEDFLDSLQVVNRAVKRGNIYQILDCVLIDATKNKITLTAQDGKEITIKRETEGEIKEKGKAAIDSNYLIDIIRTMPEGSYIELEVTEKRECIIVCGESKKTIQSKDETTYPNILSVNKENKIIINELKLKKVIEKTIFSYDKNLESGNIVLKGINFNINKENIKVKSMDGYIISIVNEKINNNNTYEVNIPGSALEELNKLIKGEVNKDVIIYISEKHVAFEFNNTLFISLIIPNKYIDTDRIFNMEYSTKIEIDRSNFTDCLRRSIPVLRDNDNKPIIFDIKEEKMDINLNSLSGDSHEEIDIKKSGKDLMIAFNVKNLIKILNVIEDEKIYLYFAGSKQPVIIKDKQETYTYLLTPVKI
ncbi:MAG: DNA polymerase III subunit beta [Lachnospiraceae bacterium]|nr:DNA polymerase III subunit beta [Lachnospiraceae bacterium]